MYLVTKVVSCPGQNFADSQAFLDWFDTTCGFDGATYRAWLATKQTEGKLIYFTTNLVDADTIENISLWQDEASYLEYEGFINTGDMSTNLEAAQAAGSMVIDSTTTQTI